MIIGNIENGLHPKILKVNWHGQWQELDVALSADEEPAIGTRLLNGCIMTMGFIQNIVTIDKPR